MITFWAAVRRVLFIDSFQRKTTVIVFASDRLVLASTAVAEPKSQSWILPSLFAAYLPPRRHTIDSFVAG